MQSFLLLYFDFHFHAAGQFEFHESVDSLSGCAVDVDQAFVVRELELLASLLVNEGASVHCVDALASWERDWSAHNSVCSFHGLYDFLGRLVHEFVVVGLQFDSDFLTHNSFFTMAPIPLFKSHTLSRFVAAIRIR